MFRHLIATILIGLAAVNAAADEREAQIDRYINSEIARQRIPGLSLAIVKDGQLLLAKGYGFANLEHRVPATERTICGNLGLNDRDVRMAQLYDIVRRLVPMGTRGAIMDRQAMWLRERNRCGGDRACIGQAYDRRIRELNRVLEERVYPQGPF